MRTLRLASTVMTGKTATLDDGEIYDVIVTLTDEQVDDCDDLIREMGCDGAIVELAAGLDQAALTLTALWRMNTDEWREAQKNGWQPTIMDRAIAVAHEEIGVYIAQTAHIQERLTFEEASRLASRIV